MGMKKPLAAVFNRGPYPVGGDTDTPCQTAVASDEPYDAKWWCPTYKQIVDLGDFSHSQAIHTPGQSGNLGSKHYDDLTAPWLKGECHPMLWRREDIEGAAEGKLVLWPTENT
jgi:penicillin amidase